MHQGIIEALKARAQDIIIEKHERWLESMEVKDITLGNIIGNISGMVIKYKVHHTSVKRKRLLDGDTLDPQDCLMESSLKGSPIKKGSKCFINNSKLVEFMNDGMMT